MTKEIILCSELSFSLTSNNYEPARLIRFNRQILKKVDGLPSESPADFHDVVTVTDGKYYYRVDFFVRLSKLDHGINKMESSYGSGEQR